MTIDQINLITFYEDVIENYIELGEYELAECARDKRDLLIKQAIKAK